MASSLKSMYKIRKVNVRVSDNEETNKYKQQNGK